MIEKARNKPNNMPFLIRINSLCSRRHNFLLILVLYFLYLFPIKCNTIDNIANMQNSLTNSAKFLNEMNTIQSNLNLGQSIIQLRMKTTLHLTLLNYYKEYTNIKMNQKELNNIKNKSRTTSQSNSPTADKLYAYFDPKNQEIIISEKENINLNNSKEDTKNNLYLVARGIYERTRFQTGWDKLNIKTYPDTNPLIQCWVAGYLEGILSSDEIYSYYKNIHIFFHNKEHYINDIKNFYKNIDEKLRRNLSLDNLQKLKEKSEHDYKKWSYMTCFQAQLDGIHAGYNSIADKDKELDLLDFYFINSEGNFDDLKIFMRINDMKLDNKELFNTKENLEKIFETSNIEKIWKNIIRKGHCSAIVKLVTQTDGTFDMLAGHNTWSEYCEMMRILKFVDLAFEGNNQIVGMKPRSINFSSYPGVLFSGDDFYEIDSKIVILQTTLSAINKFIYKNILNIDEYIPEFIRIMVINHISESGKEWVENYKSYKNHMYITQWLVLDYNILNQINSDKSNLAAKEKNSLGKKYSKNGLLILVEEVPGSIISQDITQFLLDHTYFGSFNLSYFKKHQEILGLRSFENIDFTSKQFNPRYFILRALNKFVKKIEDFSQLLTYNGYKTPNPLIEDDPSLNDPDSGISARSDIMGQGFSGGIDFKIVNKNLVDKMTIYAYGGPTYADNTHLFPFDFSKMKGSFYDLYHQGIPNHWMFTPFYFP